MKKFFGIFIGLVMLMPMTATAECVSTDSITKCARFPTCFGYCGDANYTNQVSDPDGVSWSFYREGIPYSGTSSGYTGGRIDTSAYCTITSPFNISFRAHSGPSGVPITNGADVCVHPETWESSISNVTPTKLDGDTCPDGFFAVPYEETCGTGMVNTAYVPNCADDTSGDFCLMPVVPATVPCGLGISNLKTSTGLSIPLFAEKYTSPAIHIGYNGGICYADLTIGQEINAININYNGTVYHTTVASGDSGGDTGDEEEVFNDYKFTAITTSDTTSFSFNISAAGTFYVDWGDGTTKKIEKTHTTKTPYSHTYTTAGTYDIKLGGLATGYNSSTYTAAIDFYNDASFLGGIDGCLGCIFPTLSNGTQPSFSHTFSGTPITSIPSGLFAGITGAPADGMFYSTFSYTDITSIPSGLFSGISGAPASNMFDSTFHNTPITSIPDGLFAGIKGAPASNMFSYTFAYTDITSIPSGLFSGISGTPASSMFNNTFDSTDITSIPENLFAGINGAPASHMFDNTFSNTPITSIPSGLFAGIDTTAPLQTYSFSGTFSHCTSLTGPSARINGKYLYEIWPDATSTQVGSMYYDATGLDDYNCIPTAWGGRGETCIDYPFTATVDGMWAEFWISAAGTFYVDWGDGTKEVIEKADTTKIKYTHTYATGDVYDIKLGGRATEYGTEAAISLNCHDDNGDTVLEIIDMQGSLGAIFSTLADGTQPIFSNTFYGCFSLTSIPENLFAGISGAPASNMFNGTFQSTSINSIPENLFAGISGAPAKGMFQYTFFETDITSIPENLFAGISGAPASSMFDSTFDNTPITSIPENLFAGIDTTAPLQDYSFFATFGYCSNLTGPSARINGKYLYEIWPDATRTQVGLMYYDATGLTDYANIPYAWK